MNDLPSSVKFIQAITVDINGISRGKMLPAAQWNNLKNGTVEITSLMELYGTRSEIPTSIEGLLGNKNNVLIPDMNTVKMAPWCEHDTVLMVLCDSYDLSSKKAGPFNPRLLAKRKIESLELSKYKLMVGVENQFRLFDKMHQPITNHNQKAGQFTSITSVLPFVEELCDKLNSQSICIDSWNMGIGKGQIDIPLVPYDGIKAIDQMWLFREMSRYVARDMGYTASYMAKPIAHDTATSMYITHSLLRRDSVNAMQSTMHDGKLSEAGQNWLAGLIQHSAALTAFMNPTMNCYRRIRDGKSTPTCASYNYHATDVGYRVVTSTNRNDHNYIENRLPSSNCNIYLVIAAMIVAGLDGLNRNLKLDNPGNEKNSISLPRSLSEALKALKSDEVMKAGMGEEFVDMYIKAKTDCDVNVLRNVNLDSDTPEALLEELQKYLII